MQAHYCTCMGRTSHVVRHRARALSHLHWLIGGILQAPIQNAPTVPPPPPAEEDLLAQAEAQANEAEADSRALVEAINLEDQANATLEFHAHEALDKQHGLTIPIEILHGIGLGPSPSRSYMG
jgi:hypothetical protein